jgi:hypothetical protein
MALSCLCDLMEYEIDHRTGILWESACDSGIVPILSDLLTRGAGLTIQSEIVLPLCAYLVYITPHGQEGRWADTLPRVVASLLSAQTPLVPGLAATVLSTMYESHPQLREEFHTWG